MRDNPVSVSGVVARGRKYLETKGMERSNRVTELLVEHALGTAFPGIIASRNSTMTRAQACAVAQSIRAYAHGIPLAYITGYTYFAGRKFKVLPGVFIPRPDTETLLYEALQYLSAIHRRRPEQTLHIIDLCTGTGSLAISIAKEIPRAQVWAVDISSIAVKVATHNALLHHVHNRVHVLQGDLFAPLQQKMAPASFDLVVTNPPYVTTEAMATLPQHVRKEPQLSLHGGNKGLSFYRRIVPESSSWLKRKGMLLLEIGSNQAEEVALLIRRQKGLFGNPRIVMDITGNPRVVATRKIQGESALELSSKHA